MMDIIWLMQEGQRLHGYFLSLFYALVTVFLVLGVVMEYFRLPLGQTPSFGILVGRAIIAALLLISYKEMANALAGISDGFAAAFGNLGTLDGVLQKMSDKVEGYSMDWLNARSLIVTGLSILSYTFLFYAVIIAEAAYVFTWTVLYVFSPLLIALFVLPVTSGATKALYRSLVEVTCWKIVWVALSSLLWASVLAKMDSDSNIFDFVMMICVNLILGGSLIATPWVVHALSSSGLSGFTRDFSGVASAFGRLTPFSAMAKANEARHWGNHLATSGARLAQSSYRAAKGGAAFAQNPVQNTRYVIRAGYEKAGLNKLKDYVQKVRSKNQEHVQPRIEKNKDRVTSSLGKTKPTITNWQRHLWQKDFTSNGSGRKYRKKTKPGDHNK